MSVLVVETGAGLSNANGYVSMDDCATYCTAHGLTFATSPSTAGETAIIRATAFIDGAYRTRFPGYRAQLRSQALEWPRAYAYDSEVNVITSTEIPIEIINATCEGAAREFATPGTLAPDLERGGMTRMLKAGSVEIQYGANAAPNTVFQVIDGILARLLGSTSPYAASATRG